MRYFSPVLDILTLKRSSHSILHAERSVRFSSAETGPGSQKSQSFVDFDQNYALFTPVLDFSTFDHPFHSILHAECSAYVFQRQNKPRKCKIAIIRQF